MLMYASYGGKKEIVCMLLDLGANTDDVDNCGKTALKYAIKNGHEEISRLLSERETIAEYTHILEEAVFT
eukprot:CAMPEP_0194337712 /NCGR_PEP_ID=MMETSP0171-20130528/77184_1 /TAXON_ID=218684 /ORGANISM="Corethron pennatum, Strain L29A3" /LENGTH=69 /DNA_ID=CAMNT_0039101587 /DNA_START=697 /DNA_END=906 /DNA_ORIENTATION=+